MDMISVIYCILIGLLAGSLSGLVGIGGGIVMVPLMVLFFAMPQHMAQGTSLAVLPASIITIWVYHKSGNVNIPIALSAHEITHLQQKALLKSRCINHFAIFFESNVVR
jgi:uncharacterized membrane protein YfcA